jgi:hypothetical protein
VDIYGHCGTSIMAEAMPGEVEPIIVPAPEDGDFDSYDRGHMHQTDLDAKQHASHEQSDHHGKSPEIAMLMAESMAELYGAGITHGDVAPKQWLKAADN